MHSTLRMYLVDQTDRAVLVTGDPTIKDWHAVQTWWLPRSLISYARTEASKDPARRASYIFTLPDWKVEAASLHDYAQ